MHILGNKKWFVRALGLMLLLLLAASLPLSALTQGGTAEGNLDQAGGQGEAEPNGSTDAPDGVQSRPITEGATSASNLAGEVSLQVAGSTGRTDDPLGRVRIPLAPADFSSSNLPERVDGDAGETLTPEEVMQREAAAAAAYTSPLVIPGADFASDGFIPDSSFFSFSGGNWEGTASYGCMQAPAYLPHGATVEEMFASVYDNNAAADLDVTLWRVDNFNGGSDVMAEASTSGAFGSVQVISDISILEPMVVYPDYSYYVTTCLLDNDLRLYSVRLYYVEP